MLAAYAAERELAGMRLDLAGSIRGLFAGLSSGLFDRSSR
jgi:hypothetical protein